MSWTTVWSMCFCKSNMADDYLPNLGCSEHNFLLFNDVCILRELKGGVRIEKVRIDNIRKGKLHCFQVC